MYGNGTNRVIHMKLVIQKPYTEYYQQASDKTDDCSTQTIGNITRSRDCNQTCQRCIQTHGDIRLAILDPCKNHTYDSCHCRSNCCGKEYTGQLRTIFTCSTIETIPTKPENKASQASKWKVMSRKCVNLNNLTGFILGKLTDTRSKDFRTDQCRDTTNHMNCTGTCEIMEAKL